MPPKKSKSQKRKADDSTAGSAETKKVKNNKTEKSSSDESTDCELSSLLTDSGWQKALATEFEKDYFKKLEKELKSLMKSKTQIFPPQDLIFNALNRTPLNNVKVVLLGQDPYHDDGQAMGLAFSVPKGIKVPPSLSNMYKELSTDIPGFKIPDHGCLEKWADQGVLLLNATLTVEAHKANSHSKLGWQTFTDHIMKVVSDECDGVVFMLWGNFAHKKEKLIDASKHSVQKDAHPSPLSFGKFKGCKCFSKVNAALKSHGKQEIDWTL